MPNAVPETSAVAATAFTRGHHPNPPPDVPLAEPECAWTGPEQPVCDGARRCHETRTELASANRGAILGRLSASIAEINQPVCAVVMNAEAALKLLLAQPTDTEAVRRLLACIVRDGMRTGDLVSHARALMKKPSPRRDPLEINAVTLTAIDLVNDDLVMNGVSVRM